MSQDIKIAIVTNVIPAYREDMYKRLIDYYGDNLHIYCQKLIPGENLKLAHSIFSKYITLIKFISLKKEKLSWQFIPIKEILEKYDVIFFYGNPRVISNVFWATIFKLFRKKIVIWGQYHTASSNTFTKKLRLLWWRYFDYIFLYTDDEVKQFKKCYPSNKVVIGMNNGLNLEEIDAAIGITSKKNLDAWKSKHGLMNKSIILSCARLTEKNQFDLFIDCLPELIKQHNNIIWCVIGDGEVKPLLKQKARQLNVDKYIKWIGEIYTQDELAPWFMCSRLLVHPGSIGLSLIHAMSYGLPVVTHDNKKTQMPEFAVLKNEYNGMLYRENFNSSLIATVNRLLEDDNLIHYISKNSRKTVEKSYNTRVMAERFIQLSNMI